MTPISRPLNQIPAMVEIFEHIQQHEMLNGMPMFPTIDIRLSWAELSSTERKFLRFAYEILTGVECPYPLHIF